MLIKKKQKSSVLAIVIVFIIIFYYMLRVMTLANSNGGVLSFEYFSTALNELYKIGTPIDITSKNLAISVGVSLFVIMIYETYKMQNKKNIQEDTYGSAEWQNPKDIAQKKDKDFENNMILTQTEQVSKNMKISQMNRHVILLGRPGTRKVALLF